MNKKILLAEDSDTIRNLAETILLQHGLEVLPVASDTKAIEILEYTKPDLIVVSSDMKYKGKHPLYQEFQRVLQKTPVPMLILADQNSTGLPFPDEMIIAKPFNPKELTDKVKLLSGTTLEVMGRSGAIPVPASELEEQAIDHAVDPDAIKITESEVMSEGHSTQDKVMQHDSKMLGLSINGENNSADSGKVESLMIRDENADIESAQGENKKAETPEENLNENNDLDILNDQYGLVEPLGDNNPNQPANHDYSWFLNELQKENDPNKPFTEEPGADEPISFESNSNHLEPEINVNSLSQPEHKPASTPQSETEKANSGVDNFIDEFKKEMEKISDVEPETMTVKEPVSAEKQNENSRNWYDSSEKVTDTSKVKMEQQFVSELAEKLAAEIVGKIERDQLMGMIKSEMGKYFNKK